MQLGAYFTVEENIGKCLHWVRFWGFSNSELNLCTVKEMVGDFEKIGKLLHQKLCKEVKGKCSLGKNIL